MTAWLRFLGVAVLALGFGVGGYAGALAVRDDHFVEVAAAYERHQEHPLFQAEYYAAAGRHYGLIAGAIGSALGGVVAGSLLLGIAAVLERLSRRS